MKDYYSILGLKPHCTNAEVRRAYRFRAKSLHPDHIGDAGTAQFLALKEAYEVLVSETTRQSYDFAWNATHGNKTVSSWDYREFLHGCKDDPESLSKLICYDLLHDLESEATELYDAAQKSGFFSLREYLDREDFMDFAFLLAESYMKQNAVVKAYRLLRGIAELEEQGAYFKHFYVEVLDHLASIVSHKLPEDSDNRLRMVFLNDLLTLSYTAKEEARLRKILSELLSSVGEHQAAAEQLFQAYDLAPNLPGIAQTVNALKKMGIGRHQ